MVQLTVRGIVVYDGKLLCCRNHGNDFWCLPGGKVDPGESVIDALTREIVEETGIVPVRGELVYINQFTTDEGTDVVDLFFMIENAEDYISINLALTSHGEHELEEIAFIDPRHVSIKPVFLAAEAGGYLTGTPDGSVQFRVGD